MPETVDRVAAWRALLLAHSRAVRAIESELDAADTIPLGWYDVLLELDAAPDGRLRMQELGLRAVLSRTRVSRIVGELATAGLADRVADPDDGRVTLAAITPAGQTALRSAAPVYLAGIDRHFTRYLTNGQQQAIATGLQRVIDAHQATLDPRR
ncbi:MAG: MarR family transcriptional regulator [Ilumatobacter sp.]|nr:MarR family transcriptional regulator [Ilumatobacter sp.]